MDEGAKAKVPEGLIVDAAELPPEPVKLDTSDPAAMKEALKDQFPQGVDFEFEEIDDDEYERVLKQSRESAEKDKEEPLVEETAGHVYDEDWDPETQPNPYEHDIDEL